MNLNLQKKKVLITGASRGIGRAIALALAAEGARVALTARTESALRKVSAEMGEDGGHYYVAGDLTKDGAPRAVCRQIRRDFGDPDIVINNLGDTLGIRDPYCPVSDWRRVFRINLEVAIEINNQYIPAMRHKGWGRIINIASNASMENSGPVTYCVTKAALASYSLDLGRLLEPQGILVAAVMPGAILARGSYWDRMTVQRPAHVKRYIKERLPLSRFGKPQEVAPVVAFLCSDLAAGLAGERIPVDGGQSLHFFWPLLNIG